jgi:hypothetical protein
MQKLKETKNCRKLKTEKRIKLKVKNCGKLKT